MVDGEVKELGRMLSLKRAEMGLERQLKTVALSWDKYIAIEQ